MNNNVVARMAQDLQIPMPDKLPQSVQDVCSVFETQFTQTADLLETRAQALEDRAAQLRAMAKRIANAAGTVPESLKRWVEEEMAYREAANRLGAVNPDRDFV